MIIAIGAEIKKMNKAILSKRSRIVDAAHRGLNMPTSSHSGGGGRGGVHSVGESGGPPGKHVSVRTDVIKAGSVEQEALTLKPEPKKVLALKTSFGEFNTDHRLNPIFRNA